MRKEAARKSRNKKAPDAGRTAANKAARAGKAAGRTVKNERAERPKAEKKTSRQDKTEFDILSKSEPQLKPQKSNTRFTFVVMFYIIAIAAVSYMIFAEKFIAASYVDIKGSLEGRTLVTADEVLEITSKEGHLLTIQPFSELEFVKLGHHSKLVLKKGLIEIVIVDRIVSPKITVQLPQSKVSGRGASFVVGCSKGYDYSRVQAGDISVIVAEQKRNLGLREEVAVVNGVLVSDEQVSAARYQFEKARLLDPYETLVDVDFLKRKDHFVKDMGRFTNKAAMFKGGYGLELDHFEKLNTKSFSIACWTQVGSNSTAYNYIVGQSDYSTNQSGGWQFVINPEGKLSFTWCKLRDTSGDTPSWEWDQISGLYARNGQWVHLVAAVEPLATSENAVKVSFYINGKYVATKESSLINPLSNNKLSMGRLPKASLDKVEGLVHGDFLGVVDEFSMFSGRLTDDLIKELFELGKP